MHVNMYYINDVKCEGPGGGLAVSIRPVHDSDEVVKVGISGYQGQNGGMHYLSAEEGHPSYNGSLAVKTSEDQTCHFIVESM